MNILTEIKQQGFVFLKKYMPGESTQSVSEKIGEIIEIDKIPIVQSLKPRGKDESPKNIYSGNFGLSEFPFHTDLAHWYIPPKFLLLRAITPTKNTITKLVDYKSIIYNVDNELIERALFRPRKKINGRLALLKLHQTEIYRSIGEI